MGPKTVRSNTARSPEQNGFVQMALTAAFRQSLRRLLAEIAVIT